MSITVERKQELIKEYGDGGKNTGAPEVQVALLSERIKNLTEHLQTHVRRTQCLPVCQRPVLRQRLHPECEAAGGAAEDGVLAIT